MDQLKAYKILACEPTDDLRIIKKAYAKKLKEVHPEDDPEGFLLVKEAYEYLKDPHQMQPDFALFEKPIQQENQMFEDNLCENTIESKEQAFDYDELLKQEQHRQELMQDTLKQLEDCFKNPKCKKKDIMAILENETVQSFVTSQSFKQELVQILNHYALNQQVKKYLILFYDLKKPKSEFDQQFKQAIHQQNKVSQLTIILPVIFVIAVNAIRMEVDSDFAMLMLCVFVQFIFVFAIGIATRKNHSLSYTLFLTSSSYLIVFYIFLFALALSESATLDFYIDVFTPLMLIALLLCMICGGISLVQWVIHKMKSR